MISYIKITLMFNIVDLPWTDTNKQVNNQQIALIFSYKALLHVSATARGHFREYQYVRNYTAPQFDINLLAPQFYI
jgi:hypothetical protein